MEDKREILKEVKDNLKSSNGENKFIDDNSIIQNNISLNEYFNLLIENKRLILTKGYNVKYRRLFLNTNEYFISCIILLILLNFLIKNFKVIFK